MCISLGVVKFDPVDDQPDTLERLKEAFALAQRAVPPIDFSLLHTPQISMIASVQAIFRSVRDAGLEEEGRVLTLSGHYHGTHDVSALHVPPAPWRYAVIEGTSSVGEPRFFHFLYFLDAQGAVSELSVRVNWDPEKNVALKKRAIFQPS